MAEGKRPVTDVEEEPEVVAPGGGGGTSTVVAKKGQFEIAGVSRLASTFDVTEKAMVKLMDDITEEEVLAFSRKMDSIQGREISDLVLSLFDFMGFDPLIVIKKLVMINRYYRVTKNIEEETEEILKQDIVLMVCANVVMGNLQVKSRSRRSAKGKMVIEYMMKKYDVRVGSTGAGLPSDVLTFPRIANSFPTLTCKAAKILPSKNFTSAPFKTRAVPLVMRVSAFASFCHETLNERTRIFLLEGVCAYSCDQTIVVHEGEKKKKKIAKDKDVMTPEMAYGLQWDYILVASGSPVPPLPLKRAILGEFLVENMYSSLKEVIENFRSLLKLKDPIPTESEFQSDVRAFINGTPASAVVGSLD